MSQSVIAAADEAVARELAELDLDAAIAAAEAADARWTVVAEDGLAMFREDLFSREEAQAYIAENPRTNSGRRQYAVPTSVARRLGEMWRAIGDRHDEAATIERELAVRVELGLLTEAGVAVERDELLVRYAGPGRGWYVVRRYRLEGFPRTITLAGPFTSREAAEAAAEARR